LGVTVAVNVTGDPESDGLDEEETVVVVAPSAMANVPF
jgi:hypothetical protein